MISHELLCPDDLPAWTISTYCCPAFSEQLEVEVVVVAVEVEPSDRRLSLASASEYEAAGDIVEDRSSEAMEGALGGRARISMVKSELLAELQTKCQWKVCNEDNGNVCDTGIKGSAAATGIA